MSLDAASATLYLCCGSLAFIMVLCCSGPVLWFISMILCYSDLCCVPLLSGPLFLFFAMIIGWIDSKEQWQRTIQLSQLYMDIMVLYHDPWPWSSSVCCYDAVYLLWSSAEALCCVGSMLQFSGVVLCSC